MSCPMRKKGPSGAALTHAEMLELREDVRAALISQKSIAMPIAMRVAWHASGTYDMKDGTGGSDGARMRFEPEKSDPANAGLGIVRDMLHEVKKKHPRVSEADLWTLAGALSVEFAGGPAVAHAFGRTDDSNGAKCPAPGRLPDAALGAEHLREVFYRMGFGDREIVALSGGHTLGSAHLSRSGFDGRWTTTPLKFNNEYFRNLMYLNWEPRAWDGNFQYCDSETKQLFMLPTDIALKTDPGFRPYAELYARDEQAFFRDFSEAFSKLLSLGTPACPHMARAAGQVAKPTERQRVSRDFREFCMHGMQDKVEELSGGADVESKDDGSLRTGLHKAAYWGHAHTCAFLLDRLGMKGVNEQDSAGDTALHDAARFGHTAVCSVLLRSPLCDPSIRNHRGETALDVAREYEKDECVALLSQRGGGRSKL